MRAPLAVKLFLLDHLRVLLHAGVPIAQALSNLREHTEQRPLAGALAKLQSDIEGGEPLAESMERIPGLLSPISIELLRAGEQSGDLEQALQTTVEYLRRTYDLRRRVLHALLYPAIVIGAMILIGAGIVLFVLPQLLSIFEGVDVPLPFTTKALLTFSNIMGSHGPIIGILLIAITATTVLLARSSIGKPTWHRFLLTMGRGGKLISKLNTARIARTLAGLLTTDIPIVRALELTAGTLGNIHYQHALREAARAVEGGAPIVQVFDAHPELFSPTVRQLIGIGERSGALDQLLRDLATFYETDIEQELQNLTTIIEPILIVSIGGAVAFLAIAVLQPMYTIAQSI